MSAAASASDSRTSTVNTNQQTSLQGASGAQSPTVSSGQDSYLTTNYNSDGGVVTENAIDAVSQVVQKALDGAGALAQAAITSNQKGLQTVVDANTASTSQQQTATSQAGQDQLSLIQGVLANEQALATAQGTPQSAQNDALIKYGIIGGLAVLALGIVAFFATRK